MLNFLMGQFSGLIGCFRCFCRIPQCDRIGFVVLEDLGGFIDRILFAWLFIGSKGL